MAFTILQHWKIFPQNTQILPQNTHILYWFQTTDVCFKILPGVQVPNNNIFIRILLYKTVLFVNTLYS